MKLDDCLGTLRNNEDCVNEINDDGNIKRTNNTSLLGTATNNAKHNEVSNDNNIEYNHSYNNEGCLVKCHYIDAHGINHISEANFDNSTKADGHNEQTTIKIRTNNHNNNERWFCSTNNYIDPIIDHNNMNNNNNNNNNVGHSPSKNDGNSIGDIDVDDIPTSYNFLCHATTGDTDSHHC